VPVHFFFFLGANAINYLVIAMLSVALGWHIYQNTGNPFHLALVGLMQVSPVFVFFFATGWIVDTFARKKILTCCAIADAIILLALTMVMLADSLNLTLLFGLLFAHGSVMALYFPASQAIIPNIVPQAQIRRAIAFSSTVNNIAQTGGPLIAGLLIAAINFHIYAVMTCLMVMSALSYQLLPNLPRIKPTPRSWEHIIGGLKFVRLKFDCFWCHRARSIYRLAWQCGDVIADLCCRYFDDWPGTAWPASRHARLWRGVCRGAVGKPSRNAQMRLEAVFSAVRFRGFDCGVWAVDQFLDQHGGAVYLWRGRHG